MTHRSSAQHELTEAESWLYDQGDPGAAIAHALVSIAHSLAAQTSLRCACGVEKPIQHEEWCTLGPSGVLS